MTENLMTEIFNGRNITTFLPSLGGVSMVQVLYSEEEEQLGSSYHPGIHLFKKYFYYTSYLQNKYNHINFMEEMDTEY